MALTLIEQANGLFAKDPVRSAYITMYAESDIMKVLPFENIQGNAKKIIRQHTLPGVGYRAVNGAYTESTGSSTPVTEGLIIAGGDLDVDKFLVDTGGPEERESQERNKVMALSLAWTRSVIKGDQTTNALEFNGLQKRTAGDQLIAAGSTANGDPLSLGIMDEALDACAGATHIGMSLAMRRKFSVAARSTSIAGNITMTVDEFGQQVFHYNGIPIIIFDEDNEDNKILDFNETCPGGGTLTGTSIYIMSVGSGKFTGIQSGPPSVRDLGELDGKPVYRTRVDWYNSIMVHHEKAVVRIWGISDAAITA
jgi:hypothetical protein